MTRFNLLRLNLFRLISVAIMLAVLAGSFYIYGIYCPAAAEQTVFSDTVPEQLQETLATPEPKQSVAVPPETAPPLSTSNIIADFPPEQSNEPTEPLFSAADGTALNYSWGESVPESTAAADEWFADAAFIGNSLCDGLMLFGTVKQAQFFCAQSITVQNIYTEECVNAGGEYISITEALARGSYRKVFVMLGINEVFRSTDWFYEHYAALIDYLREIEPEAEIYLQAILPVSETKSNAGMYTKENVLKQNEQIMQLCEDKNAYYIDLYSYFADADGYLPVEDSSDGVHLTRAGYQLWSDYLKTHTISEAQ